MSSGPYARSIYEIPATEEYQLLQGSTPLSKQVPFTFYSIGIDNPTQQWIHIVNTLRFVPPGVTGYIINVPGLDILEAEFAAPPGVTQGPSSPDAFAVLTVYSWVIQPTGSTQQVSLTSNVFPDITVTGATDLQGNSQADGPFHFHGKTPLVDVTHPSFNGGADATGATDSTVAIAQALAVGGETLFPPGAYLASQVKPQSGQIIRGAGRGATTLKTTSNAAFVYLSSVLNVTVRDMSLLGSAVQGPNPGLNLQALIWVDNAGGPSAGHIYIQNVDCSNGVIGMNITNGAYDVHVADAYIQNIYQAAASVWGVGLWLFKGGNFSTIDNVVIETTDGSGFIIDTGTNTGGGQMVNDVTFGHVIVFNAGQGYACAGGVLLKGCQHCSGSDLVVDGAGTAAFAVPGLAIRQDQQGLGFIPRWNTIRGVTIRNTGNHALEFAGAQNNLVSSVESHNVGIALVNPTYTIVFEHSTVIGGQVQSDCLDNIVDGYQHTQDGGTGRQDYGVLFDGSQVNCFRNRVLNAQLGTPTTAQWLYNGANAPSSGANANVVVDLAYHSGVPAVVAGANNGGAPPAPTVAAGSNDRHMVINFGAGNAPAPGAGAQVGVTYSKPYAAVPMVFLQADGVNAEGLLLSVTGRTVNGFVLTSNNAPVAGVPTGTYVCQALVEPVET